MYPALEWLIIALASSFSFFCLVYWLHAKGKVRGDLLFWAVCCPTLIFFGILAGAKKYGNPSSEIIRVLNSFFAWVVGTLGLGGTRLLVAFFITALGFGAHHFKKKNQKWYGNIEIMVGFFSALFVAGTLSLDSIELSKWTTLAGAAYVIARGLGNRESSRLMLYESTKPD